MSDQSFQNDYIRYGLVLVAYYAGIAIITALPAFSWLSSALQGMAFLMPSIAAISIGERFLKAYHRLPTPRERERLINGCILAAILINIVLAISVWAFGFWGTQFGSLHVDFADYSGGSLFLYAVFVIGGNYLMTRSSFGWMLRSRAKRLDIAVQH